MDWLAICISFAALVISITQAWYEHKKDSYEKERAKFEATINAFAELQRSVFDEDVFNTTDIECLLNEHNKKVEANETDQKWEKFSEYLAQIERFAVGVNMGVYDIKTLDRIAGSHIIKMFNRVWPIINYKRQKSKTSKRYEEFEKMANALSPFNTDVPIVRTQQP